jgi:ketopantoate reductase
MTFLQEVYREVLSALDPGAMPNILVGSVTHGCYMTSPTHAVHAGRGSITLAQVDPGLPTLTDPGHQRHWVG